MNAASALSLEVGKKAACDAFTVPRSSFYRYSRRIGPDSDDRISRPAPPLALTLDERENVLGQLHSERFQDKAPYQVYATLLDEGVYHCSIRTMYRILEKEHGQNTERGNRVRRRNHVKPELLATGPNQVWSWDITKLKSTAKWTYFHLYVIMDIFSGHVVGWMVAHREGTDLAKRLIEETCAKQNIDRNQLTLHADRGSSMKSKGVAQLLADLGVTKTHSRPHVSNDNPYSEAQFKTLKYCPEFPGSFGSIQEAGYFCKEFFWYYCKEHRHSGIGLVTPEQMHYGMARQIYNERAKVLYEAFVKNPWRFKGKLPLPPPLPEAAWINEPKPEKKHSD